MKYYRKAEEEIKRRREINTEKLNLREREIEKAIPEYRDIRREMAKTGGKLSAIILSGKDVEKQLEKLQRENLAAQETIKSLLLQHRFAADYLNDIFTCEKCHDSGVYQSRRCSCFKEIVKRLAVEELNKAAPMKLCSFEMFDVNFYPDRMHTDTGINIRSKMARNFTFCKDYADNFHLPYGGILMLGKTGLGKTFLSLAIAKTVISKGYSVIYGSAPDLLRKIEKEHFGREADEDSAGVLQGADLLIFDDLGAEFESQFYVSAFYNLINSRVNAGLPTIINTNLDRNQLKARYGDRVMSRTYTMEWLPFFGDDIREIKALGKLVK
jgi:DNA replication protein DnaC